MFDKDRNNANGEILERGNIELIAQKITWIFIFLVLINEFNYTNGELKISYIKPYFGAWAFLAAGICILLNSIKGWLIRKSNITNLQEYDEKTWYICRVIDILIIILVATFFDNNGKFLFLVLVICLFVTFDDECKRTKQAMILADLIYSFIVILEMYLLGNNFMNNVREFLLKLTITITFQWVFIKVSDKIRIHLKEKDFLLNKVENTYNEVEKTHKILEDRTKELEKSKKKLEESTKDLEVKNEKLSRNFSELYTLQEVSRCINSTLNIDELLNIISDMILGIMGVNYTCILMNNLQGELQVVVSNIKDDQENSKVLELFKDIISSVIENKKASLNTSNSKEEFRRYDIGSVICIPLNIKGEVIGVAIAAHENDTALNADSLEFLNAIFNQVSIAIENAELYREMKEMAEIDGLTRVFNRAYFQKEYAALKQEQNENIESLAVTIFDIDFFKKFNDTYGHQFGDLVLKQVASIGKRYLVEDEFISRYGGEEFVIIFKNKDEDYVVRKVEKIRRTIEGTEVTDGDTTASVTASFGIAFYPDDYKVIDEHFLTCADDALYDSKKNGRNKVTVWREQ